MYWINCVPCTGNLHTLNLCENILESCGSLLDVNEDCFGTVHTNLQQDRVYCWGIFLCRPSLILWTSSICCELSIFVICPCEIHLNHLPVNLDWLKIVPHHWLPHGVVYDRHWLGNCDKLVRFLRFGKISIDAWFFSCFLSPPCRPLLITVFRYPLRCLYNISLVSTVTVSSWRYWSSLSQLPSICVDSDQTHRVPPLRPGQGLDLSNHIPTVLHCIRRLDLFGLDAGLCADI